MNTPSNDSTSAKCELSAWADRQIPHGPHRIAIKYRPAAADSCPIVFVHGITASVDLWPIVLEDNFADVRCASVSLPGHAPSLIAAGLTEGQVIPELFSGIVKSAAVELFPGEQIHVVGWSTGGFTALMTAAHYPELVRSVTSISGFVRGRWHGLLGFTQLLADYKLTHPLVRWNMRELGRKRWLLNAVLNRLSARRLQPGRIATRAVDSMFEAMQRHDPSAMAVLFQALRSIDATTELAKIDAPVLVIGGAADPIILPAEADHIARHLQRGTLHQLPDTGHMFFAENRDHILELIRLHCLHN